MRIMIVIILHCLLFVPVFAQGNVSNITNLNDTIENYTGSAHSLAPDGTMVAFSTRIDMGDERVRSLCIYVFVEETSTCTAFPDDSEIWRTDRIIWSPNSSQIVMTEDLFQRQDEPDIWIYDLEPFSVFL